LAQYYGAKYVLEDYAVSYSPSDTVLRYCRDKSRSGKRRFLGMGNPSLGTEDFDLPYAQKEVEAISAYFPEPEVFFGDEASEERFKARVRDEEMMHLACHGEYNADAPLLSNLRLSPSWREDGRLEVHKVFDLNITLSH
jgi:CHAT domain-containing protein